MELMQAGALHFGGAWDLRPNVEVNPARGGRRCKPGLRRCYDKRGPGLRRLP